MFNAIIYKATVLCRLRLYKHAIGANKICVGYEN